MQLIFIAVTHKSLKGFSDYELHSAEVSFQWAKKIKVAGCEF